MWRLTTKQKFAAIFSLYIFIFLLFFYAVFFVIYQFLINRQIESVLKESIQQVIYQHLQIENDKLKITVDSNGKTLKEYFLSRSLSAVIFDGNNNVYKSYGVFALMDENENIWSRFIALVSVNTSPATVKAFNYPLPTGKVMMASVPLKYKNEQFGVMVIGKSWEEFDQAKKTILIVAGTLGVLGLIGSFLLGYILVSYAFTPVGKIIETLEGVDLEKMNKKILIKGNSSDELVNLSHKINRMFIRLKIIAKTQKEFISHASHELKKPMAKAVSTLDVIALKHDTSVEKILKVRNDLMEADSLLDNLLSLGKLGVNNLPKGDSNLYQVVKESADKFSAEIKARDLKIEVRLGRKILVNIPARYLSIIVDNLISNAIKYSYDKTTIQIKGKPSPYFTLEIEDHGIGMDGGEIKKVFKHFYRSEEAVKSALGYGLGMSIVKQICDLYKIKISVSSVHGRGTIVTLKFFS